MSIFYNTFTNDIRHQKSKRAAQNCLGSLCLSRELTVGILCTKIPPLLWSCLSSEGLGKNCGGGWKQRRQVMAKVANSIRKIKALQAGSQVSVW